MRSLTLITVAVMALSGATACTQGVRQALGTQKSTPDEFRVVTIAPLVVPPEYNLRPPQPGAPRPEDLFPDEQARRAILGSATPDSASAGERAFLAQAAATVANENARGLVDGEGGQIVRKPQGFADRVLFWRGRGEAPASEQAAPLSPEEEAERIEAVAGSGTVVIPRPRTVRQRLPGI
jgi:hypothetical protein